MAIRGNYKEFENEERAKSNAVWHMFDSVPRPSDDLESRILSDTTYSDNQEIVQKSSILWVYRIAAAILLLVGVGIIYYLLQDDVRQITSVSYQPAIYQAERGEKIELHLTDHIYIQLNSETELQVISQGDELTPLLVFLSGEAYFNIHKAPEGFEIVTDAGVVQIVGTAFNVRARGEEIEVAVETGVVALRGLPDESIDTVVQVPAGYKSIKKRNFPAENPIPVDIDRYLSWRKGKFVFEQTPLNEVIRNLERAYNVRIDLHGSNLDAIRVTGEFGQEPLMQILNEICWSANLRYRQEENTYILYQPD